MAMSLREKQALFARLLGEFLVWVHSHPGWELTLGEAYVDDRRTELIHMPGSLHRFRLAIDINLFVGGVYIAGEHPVWLELGKYWESLHPLTRWGGNWDKDDKPVEPGEGDFNHYSVSHWGKA